MCQTEYINLKKLDEHKYNVISKYFPHFFFFSFLISYTIRRIRSHPILFIHFVFHQIQLTGLDITTKNYNKAPKEEMNEKLSSKRDGGRRIKDRQKPKFT